jgi:hypothetical protein
MLCGVISVNVYEVGVDIPVGGQLSLRIPVLSVSSGSEIDLLLRQNIAL